MLSWRIIGGWVVAVAVVTLLTTQIVGLADSQVGEAPVAIAASPTVTSNQGLSSTTTRVPASSATNATAPGVSTSSSTPPTEPSLSSSTSSSSSSSTPSTLSESPWSLRTIDSAGGVVVVRFRPGEVQLQAATPAPGFSVEIDDDGPERVRVEFESETTDVRIEAEWKDGSLQTTVKEPN